jgi:phosphoribosylformimino-5-aminoimidazole carboxamide ribotide isomerase
MMRIWPAIDLLGGKCVRLQQGDYQRETVFGEDPLQVAQRWIDEGTDCLHLVDLDGARDGKLVNGDVIRRIVRNVNATFQLGGGIRGEESIRSLVDLGLDRLVIGTQALKDPDWFRAMALRYPGKLVLGIDARDGWVATDGWLETSQTRATELADQFSTSPLAAIVYTDIARDGMLTGPNVSAMREMQQATTLPVVASGGVSDADDVSQLASIPMDGVIIGRALYEGSLTLADALSAGKVA